MYNWFSNIGKSNYQRDLRAAARRELTPKEQVLRDYTFRFCGDDGLKSPKKSREDWSKWNTAIDSIRGAMELRDMVATLPPIPQPSGYQPPVEDVAMTAGTIASSTETKRIRVTNPRHDNPHFLLLLDVANVLKDASRSDSETIRRDVNSS